MKKQNLEIKYLPVEDLIPYARNSRTHSPEQVAQIASSIKEFGFTNPVLIDSEKGIIAGHGRVMGAQKLGLKEVPTIEVTGWTDAQKRAYIIADNKLALNAGWDNDLLKLEFEELKGGAFDLELTGFDLDEIDEILDADIGLDDIEEDETPEPPVEPKTQLGDVWTLGNHRVMCGDSTNAQQVATLMAGQKADLVFTDPPYGMKKEAEGVKNDNLNYDDLLDFNKKWIPLSFANLKANGSWYCWGIDEPLMDIYSHILKPMAKRNEITFRNLLTWDKGSGQGQNQENTRMYAPADEKCLFVMCGYVRFSVNADNYFEGWEPVRKYLADEAESVGLTPKDVKEVCGVGMFGHWFTKSQWTFIPEKYYRALQEAYPKAFKRAYSDIFREYENIKFGFDGVKRSYYDSRAYFDNTHDNMNNVWHFSRTSQEERALTGGHATPKPIALCARAIKSSSREGETVLDLFGGSGTTLIACEQTKRKARLLELDPRYCDVIIERWQAMTGLDAVRDDGVKFNDLLVASDDV